MITSKNFMLMTNVIPGESKFESHFYHNDLISVYSNYIPRVTFHRCGNISR